MYRYSDLQKLNKTIVFKFVVLKYSWHVNSNCSLRNVCWTIFVYNTPIIFARRKQLCACAHKLWKGSIAQCTLHTVQWFMLLYVQVVRQCWWWRVKTCTCPMILSLIQALWWSLPTELSKCCDRRMERAFISFWRHQNCDLYILQMP